MEVFPAISIETRKISTMSFQYRRFIITGEEEEEEAKIENLLIISIDQQQESGCGFCWQGTAQKVVTRETHTIISNNNCYSYSNKETHITHDIHIINHELLRGARSF